VIRARALGKTFGPWIAAFGGRGRCVRALAEVTLDVERGEIFGLLGPNGAGKTTLLRIIATLLLPSEGHVSVAGLDVARDPLRVRRVVALASGGDHGFYWRLSGRENLRFFAGLLGYDSSEARRRASEALVRADLGAATDESVQRYSTGMRQRLGLARALLGSPAVLLLDEPTRSLDPTAATNWRTWLRTLATDGGTTIVLATHALDEAEALCDRVAVLASGRVRALLARGDGAFGSRYLSALGTQA